jgi:molecular chaperone GrpE
MQHERQDDTTPAVEPGEQDAAPGQEQPGEENPIDRLTGIIAALEAEKQQLREQALRALAEAENTRRRVDREKGEAVKYAAIPLLRDVVRGLDDLTRALAAVPAEAAEGNEQLKTLRDGVALTERDLLAGLQRHGVHKLVPLGEPLDPNVHEAMFEVPTDQAPPGTVVEVLEAGWKQHDRLIRPARVGVAKAP